MITTSYRPSEYTIHTAQSLSVRLGDTYCSRNKQPIEKMLERAASDLLVIGKERFELYTKQGRSSFSPEYSDVPRKAVFEREAEPLLKAAGLREGIPFRLYARPGIRCDFGKPGSRKKRTSHRPGEKQACLIACRNRTSNVGNRNGAAPNRHETHSG